MRRTLICRPGGTVSKLAGTTLKKQKLYTLDFHLYFLAFKNYYQSQKVGLKILFILKVVSFGNIFQVKIVIGDAKVHTFLIQCFE